MPYIKSDDGRREALANGDTAQTAGELNYQIFYYVKHNQPTNVFKQKVIYGFVVQFLGTKPNYQRYNDMTGALVRCAKEIRRRLHLELPFLWQILESYDEEIDKYEDKKIEENGDVE